ncbi:MAG TPA: HD domain-containing phosphohydrolase [Vicinamibacterales bacterium]|nr:HD domain-containing phosphohydrolase [Vicinamibacterales bacterium]
MIGRSLGELASQPPGFEWLILASMTVLAGCFTIKLPSLPANLSVSETFVFTSVLLFGSAAGTVTVVVEALVISFWQKTARSTSSRLLFNAAAPAIAIRASADAFFLASRVTPGQITSGNLQHVVLPIFGLALLYFAFNSCLIAAAMATDRGSAAIKMWRRNLPAVSVNYFVGSCVAMFISAYAAELNLAVLGIIVPILLVSYYTFRTSMGRLEDANRHVRHINELYLSTIEALAMAVDAKDQITHGHIRRVQVYATQLAERLGVTDEQQLRAIEAAALLHDMGKLAIPEHILNKPGKLTSAEFEKMKRHADIGADLLSSISFPYPVVPIVRHHHENWNGTGYPSGLSGHDIPLGARILSVVDCFDALTSDRPYRPRMSDDDSFAILRERSGKMYDPLVVDTFMAVFPDISPLAIQAGQQARSFLPTLSGSSGLNPLEQIRTNAEQTTLLEECALALKHSTSRREATEVAAQFMAMLTPAKVCAFFEYNAEEDALVCVQSAGDTDVTLAGLLIKNGERTTGWAVAHDSVMANSPATLDLMERASMFNPPLRSAIVAPLKRNGTILGALAGYTSSSESFSDDHQYAIERIAAAFVARHLASPQPAERVVPVRSVISGSKTIEKA